MIGQQPKGLEAWVGLLRAHAALHRSLSAELQADHGLTVSEFEALMLLARAEEQSLRRVDLVERLQLTASGVTRLLDGLEERALVGKARCAEDARVTYAVLTDAGLAKLEAASSSHAAAIQALFEERFTDAEVAQLAELLERLPGAPIACAD